MVEGSKQAEGERVEHTSAAAAAITTLFARLGRPALEALTLGREDVGAAARAGPVARSHLRAAEASAAAAAEATPAAAAEAPAAAKAPAAEAPAAASCPCA